MAVQDVSRGNYRAVSLVPVTGPALVKRDFTDNSANGIVDLLQLVDASGALIGVAGNPLVTSGGGSSAVAPIAGTASTVTTGGTAVTLVTGPVSGGYITNPTDAAAQGIATAENAYVDPVATPGSTDAGGNGTTTLLTPGQSYSVPALKAGSVIKGNAATSGHKLTVVVWL